MTPYRNLKGDSNVVSYEATDDSIHVVFRSGNVRNYLYDQTRPGKAIVDHMKALAAQGHGLNAYIRTAVGTKFARKW